MLVSNDSDSPAVCPTGAISSMNRLETLIMEVMQMTRFFKALFVTGLSSVYLMQAPCTFAGHGFSIIPNGAIPNPFQDLIAGL